MCEGRTLGPVGFRALVTLIVATHFVYLAYAVFGGFLAWRWPRTIWVHLAGAVWLFLVVVAHLDCPLTWAEDQARQRAGMPPLAYGFIDEYVNGVLFPRGWTTTAQAVVALLVLGSWAGFGVLRHRRGRVTVG
jgi:hypothetical protein